MLIVFRQRIHSILKSLTLIILSTVFFNCATSMKILRPDGSTEYLITCGSGTGWNVCYEKANEVCPSGYKTLSEDAGFNRKEMKISCPTSTK